eukprot:1161392-Pelagomonas_calceolata.AAC.1
MSVVSWPWPAAQMLLPGWRRASGTRPLREKHLFDAASKPAGAIFGTEGPSFFVPCGPLAARHACILQLLDLQQGYIAMAKKRGLNICQKRL